MGSMICKISSTPYSRLINSRVPKGFVPILVGMGEASAERFLVHVKQLSNPFIIVLLELAADEHGYGNEGILRITCDADYFRKVVTLKEF